MKLSFARSRKGEWNDAFFYKKPENRGTCKGFSRGARRRMMDKLNTIREDAVLPVFVTMTLPDDVYVNSVTEFAKQAKVYLSSFMKRLLRVAPGASAVWRIEWQKRKSGEREGEWVPHVHMMVFGLKQRYMGMDVHGDAEHEAYVDETDPQKYLDFMEVLSVEPSKELGKGVHRTTCTAGGRTFVFEGKARYVDRCSHYSFHYASALRPSTSPDDRHKMSFADWASLAWYNVVESHNPDHLKAGVRCERVRSWGGVMSYTAKYMSKADDEALSDSPMGRQWGIVNRAAMPWADLVTLPLSDEVGVRLRRVMKRYIHKRARFKRNYTYGITVYASPSAFERLWEYKPPDPF